MKPYEEVCFPFGIIRWTREGDLYVCRLLEHQMNEIKEIHEQPWVMATLREAALMALDALNNFDKGNHGMRWQVPVIKTLRAALAQPEEEEDYDAIANKQLASLKAAAKVTFEDAVVRAVHKLYNAPPQQPEQDEREKVAQWMIQRSYATGHGDTTEDLLAELEWQVREAERNNMVATAAELGWALYGGDPFEDGVRDVAAIRARGQG